VEVASEVDRMPEANEPLRFAIILKTMLASVEGMTIYLDNMESLLVGPDNEDPEAFGQWRSQEVAQIWDIMIRLFQL
jgi:hypothetical protein